MKHLLFLYLVLVLFQCKEQEKKKAQPKDSNVVRAYYDNGKLRAEIPQKNNVKHGKAVEYFKSGAVYQEIDYKEGIKDGWARRYFETGQLAQETPYLQGKIQGLQKKYRSTGQVASEATYLNNEPCVGLKEYLLDGSLKKKYPSIVITPIDEVESRGVYTLRISLTEKVKEVEYFTGQLSAEKCLGSNASKVWSTDRYGVAEIEYRLLPGMFIMERVNIIAKVKTTQGNYYLTQHSYNVAVESR